MKKRTILVYCTVSYRFILRIDLKLRWTVTILDSSKLPCVRNNLAYPSVMELIDPKRIIHGPRVSLRRCHYQGHCMILRDPSSAIDEAIAAIDYIGKKYDSED